ncbi:MAG: ribonuclease H-like domain-containing protein, partial [Thermodesulfobacteriota bacterium]
MLRHGFTHLTGIGPKTEARLWASGIKTWDDLLQRFDKAGATPNPDMAAEIKGAMVHLERRDPLYFERLLPPDHNWRLYFEFQSSAAFLDIETNGIMGSGGYITSIALYDGESEHYYVRGRNLKDFPQDLRRYSLLVTYNGKAFDLPFIEREFKISVKKAHIDLRHILHGLGYRGGLKGCERAIGIDRGGCEGLDGYS